MTQIEDRVRSGLRAEADAVARVAATQESTPDRPRISVSGAIAAVALAVVVLVGFGGVLLLTGGVGGVASDPLPTSVPTVGDPGSAFEGVWISQSDAEGGTETLTVVVSADGTVEVVVRNTVATVCSGTASTMTGKGTIEDGTRLVIPEPVYTCDNGTQPATLSGPPLQNGFRAWTLVLDATTDTLSDGIGGVWLREGAVEPTPDPQVSDPGWPQTSLEEVGEAQERADAGDPEFTWQVDPHLASDDAFAYLEIPGQVALVDRFLREVLGWEAYVLNNLEGSEWDFTDNGHFDTRFLRCVAGTTNPLYPPRPDGPAAASCAPTLDDLRYESVSLDLVQPDRIGPTGIWVVNGWRPVPFAQADPAVTKAQATQRLEDFLAARIAGRGAEGYVDIDGAWLSGEVPLLYATTSGARYERFEFEIVGEPWWPFGVVTFSVRLFADGGTTVVEQEIYSDWNAGRSAGVEGALWISKTTTENGQPVPMVFAADGRGIRNGEVTYSSPDPWGWGIYDEDVTTGFRSFSDSLVAWFECAQFSVPTGAAAFAQAISTDPNLESTVPVAARVGGFEAVSIDIDLAPGDRLCLAGFGGDYYYRFESQALRIRLYLVDVPEGMSMDTLMIAVMAPDGRFAEVVEQIQPVIDSIEFHPGR